MDAKSPARTPERGITRRELEAVIRRAAELYAADADADERITEEELLRIASELGLPPRHVRQALFELPAAPASRSLLDQLCGSAGAGGTRVIPSASGLLFDRLEEYLTTREYLRPLRRQHGRGWYGPAEDAISKVARTFSRPAGRFYIARARRVMLAVEPLENQTAHVRIDVDLADQRRSDAAAGAVIGGLLGAAVGAGLAASAGGAAGEVFGQIGGSAAAILTFGGTMTSGLAAGIGLARARFRRRIGTARLEIEGLLDRLERDDSLDPPPAPWRRRLVSRFRHRLGPAR